MIRTQMLRQVFYIFGCCKNLRFTPKCINPPSDISLASFSFLIPPRIHLGRGILYAPNIFPIVRRTIIKPRALCGMKSNFSVIFLWARQIDFVVRTVDISTPKHEVTSITKRVHFFGKIGIKNQFSIPSLARFSSIRKINPKNVKNFIVFFQNHMRNATFIGGWITFKSCLYRIHIFANFIFYPHARPSITRLFCWIIKSLVSFWRVQIRRKFVGRSLDFLQKK